jgi:hypothetical protein
MCLGSITIVQLQLLFSLKGNAPSFFRPGGAAGPMALMLWLDLVI